MGKEKDLFEERKEHDFVPVDAFGGKIFAPVTLAIFDEAYPYNPLNRSFNQVNPWEGKYLQTCCSPVLCMPTIWQANVQQNKSTIYPNEGATSEIVALFPSIQELKFEGPDRIATAEVHQRFFPIPREPCNQTVSWSRRPFLKPHEFDSLLENRRLTEEDIWCHSYEIGLPNDEDLQVGLPVSDNASAELPDIKDGDPYEGDKARRLLGDNLLAALDPRNVYF